MHPNQVTPALVSKFGEPTVLSVLKVPIVNFPNGRPRSVLAKRFGLAGCLRNPKAQALFKEARIAGNLDSKLDAIGELEGLPKVVELVPDVTEKIKKTKSQARLGDLGWDQQFYDTFRSVLSYIRDTGVSATAYPLIQGPPGASKTQVAVAVAAVVGRPVYPVVGGDGASDEIKAALLGGPYPSDKAPWAIAKENAYIGGLQSPWSERLLVQYLTEKDFEAITREEFQAIADLEGIREGITYDRKGAYQLAAENGGILLLEECNSFPAEVHSLLTQILENYINGECHPNFFVIATQNPAGESHPSRNPLPKEVVNRFERKFVTAPDETQYNQALQYMLTREQPLIVLAGGQKGQVTPGMLGVDIPPQMPSLLVDTLTSASLRKLVNGLSKFHKSVEAKIEEGILDPKEVEEPPTKETSFISRRNLRRLLNGIDNEVLALADAHLDDFGSMSLSQYVSLNAKQEKYLGNKEMATAIWNAIQRYYIMPNSFTTHQKVEVVSKDGGKQSKVMSNTGDILKNLARDCNLDPRGLEEIIVTSAESKVLEKKFLEFYRKAAKDLKCSTSREKEVLEKFKTLTPSQREEYCLITDKGNVTLAFSVGANPFQHIDEICPLLKSEEDSIKIAEEIATKMDKRRRQLADKDLEYLSTTEIMSCRDWVNTLRKENQVYLLPAYHETNGSKTFSLVVSVHRDKFFHLNKEGKIIDPSNSDDKKNLEELLKAYPTTKPFANMTLTLQPRDAKDAIVAAPVRNLQEGINAQRLHVSIKVGKGNAMTIGLLELVKWSPK